MKVNRLETHDRLLQFKKQQDEMGDHVMKCLQNVPSAITSPFYIWGHSRQIGLDEKLGLIQSGAITLLENTPDERLIWVPRITKPKVSPNSYLFLARKDTDVIKIIWMLPKEEFWEQYSPGKMMHNENVWVSIQNYKFDKQGMDAPDKDGPTKQDETHWFKVFGEEAHKRKKMKKASERLLKPGF